MWRSVKVSKNYRKYNKRKYIERDPYSMAKPPQNEKESRDYANALYRSGYYPAGVSDCFSVGISGGCGVHCWVYQEGRCEIPEHIED